MRAGRVDADPTATRASCVARSGAAAPATGSSSASSRRAGPGPELLWEEAALPVVLRRRGAAAVHSLNWTFPLVRPCPGVVTIHDLAWEVYPGGPPPKTRWKSRTIAPRAARSAERVICVSEYTRDDVCERYGVDPEKVRVIGEAPGLPHGDAEPPPGPYLLAVGDLRPRKNLLRLVEAFRSLLRRGHSAPARPGRRGHPATRRADRRGRGQRAGRADRPTTGRASSTR